MLSMYCSQFFATASCKTKWPVSDVHLCTYALWLDLPPNATNVWCIVMVYHIISYIIISYQLYQFHSILLLRPWKRWRHQWAALNLVCEIQTRWPNCRWWRSLFPTSMLQLTGASSLLGEMTHRDSSLKSWGVHHDIEGMSNVEEFQRWAGMSPYSINILPLFSIHIDSYWSY